jgi:hypothetical protein
MKRLIYFGAAIFLAVLIFAAVWITTVHSLVIECDHPAKTIYVTDQFGQTWIYDYNYSD